MCGGFVWRSGLRVRSLEWGICVGFECACVASVQVYVPGREAPVSLQHLVSGFSGAHFLPDAMRAAARSNFIGR